MSLNGAVEQDVCALVSLCLPGEYVFQVFHYHMTDTEEDRGIV